MNKILIGIGVVSVAAAALWLTKPTTEEVTIDGRQVQSQPEKSVNAGSVAAPEEVISGKKSLAVRLADNDTYIDPESVESLKTTTGEPIHLGEYIDPDKFVAKQDSGTPVQIGETIEDPWNHVDKTVATDVREIGEPIPDPEAWIQEQVKARNDGKPQQVGKYINPDDVD